MKDITILIATSNQGKKEEILHALGDLPFTFLTLADLPEMIPPPEETGESWEANAYLKAKYYAEASGYPTISEDAGLCVDALDGWPGLVSARIADTDVIRRELVLERLKGLPVDKRTAAFYIVAAYYDPKRETAFFAHGEVSGSIGEVEQGGRGFGYDPLFVVKGTKKTFAEMTLGEKHGVSHRGKAMMKIRYFLQSQFGAKNIVVPLGVIIKDKQVLMCLRNDPHRPKFHRRWEFPGGGMELGETIEENLSREIEEEVGFQVHIRKLLQYICVKEQADVGYQVYLIPYICEIKGGDGKHSDSEVLEKRWFDPDDVLNHELVGDNAEMYKKILPEIKEFIALSR